MRERMYRPEPFRDIWAAIDEIKSVYPADYRTPWWGMKRTSGARGMGGGIYNLGYVIGYRDDARGRRWRLDYDPDPAKALHINFEQDLGHKNVEAICFRIASFRHNPGDSMWFQYVRWTTRHCEDCPPEVMQKMGGDMIWYGAFWAGRR